jgi:hypothetical protein
MVYPKIRFIFALALAEKPAREIDEQQVAFKQLISSPPETQGNRLQSSKKQQPSSGTPTRGKFLGWPRIIVRRHDIAVRRDGIAPTPAAATRPSPR